MQPVLWKACIAEFIATFALCFIGAGAIVTDSWMGGAGLVGIALAHAIVLGVMVNATGHVSGGHVNPAVTAGFLVTGRIPAVKGALYIGSQLVGGICAGFLLRAVYPASAWGAVHLGAPALGRGVGFGLGVLLEIVLTFFLVFTVFATAVDPRAPKGVYGFSIGLVLLFDILMGGPLTGAAMNPARAFGPAFAAGFWQDQAVYWIGPLIGGMGAALLYHHLLMEGTKAGQEI